jgi:D-sedoheptulose 7-phosphate isomerase
MTFSRTYLDSAISVAKAIDPADLEAIVAELITLRDRSARLFVLGVGGSAANASHAVNDFRKLCGIEAYAPTDNVSELTARTNDEGWDTVFATWLATSRATERDAIFVLSVGGGSLERNVSTNIVHALDEGLRRGCRILGIVGRDGGYTAKVAHAAVIVPTVAPELVTPLTEAFQAVIWHCLVSHPSLARQRARWEALATPP